MNAHFKITDYTTLNHTVAGFSDYCCRENIVLEVNGRYYGMPLEIYNHAQAQIIITNTGIVMGCCAKVPNGQTASYYYDNDLCAEYGAWILPELVTCEDCGEFCLCSSDGEQECPCRITCDINDSEIERLINEIF